MTEQKHGDFNEQELIQDGKPIRYQVFLPEDYSPDQQWPVILFLHGKGSRGTDNQLPVTGSFGQAVKASPSRFPCVIVVPQCPEVGAWVGPWLRSAMSCLDATVEKYNGDRKRVYIVGNSMGGYGLLYSSVSYPDKFAAGLCLCGGITPPASEYDGLKGLAGKELVDVIQAENRYEQFAQVCDRFPIWFFHGTADDVVPIIESQAVAQAMEKAGRAVTYTALEGRDHGIAAEVYGQTEAFEWLLSQQRG